MNGKAGWQKGLALVLAGWLIWGGSPIRSGGRAVAEAAETARKAKAGGLLLTHFSTSMEEPEEYLPETRRIFANTWAAGDGQAVTMRYPEGEEKAWTSLF